MDIIRELPKLLYCTPYPVVAACAGIGACVSVLIMALGMMWREKVGA